MARWLLVAFLIVPIVEIAVIIQVGQLIGVWPTVLLLVVESALGAWLVRREGRRAWASLRAVFDEGRSPDVALTDAALVLVGGTLLLTPGFVTDVVGFACILPVTRPARAGDGRTGGGPPGDAVGARAVGAQQAGRPAVLKPRPVAVSACG